MSIHPVMKLKHGCLHLALNEFPSFLVHTVNKWPTCHRIIQIAEFVRLKKNHKSPRYSKCELWVKESHKRRSNSFHAHIGTNIVTEYITKKHNIKTKTNKQYKKYTKKPNNQPAVQAAKGHNKAVKNLMKGSRVSAPRRLNGYMCALPRANGSLAQGSPSSGDHGRP